MMLLSEKLANIKDHVSSQQLYEKLEICREQALTYEETIFSLKPWRTTDPETSHWDGDQETLSELQRAVFYTFRCNRVPLDEYAMTDAYLRLQAANSDWMPYIDPELQSTSLRKRRNDLQKLGLVKRLDSEGVSPIGRAIGRYILTSAGRDSE